MLANAVSADVVWLVIVVLQQLWKLNCSTVLGSNVESKFDNNNIESKLYNSNIESKSYNNNYRIEFVQ